MAYDGSLKFDTKLDTSGFEKGAKEIAQEAKNLGKQVENTGRNMDSALKPDIGKVQEEVNKAGKAFVTAHTKLEAFNLLIKQFQETINNFNAAETVEDATRLVDQLKIQAEMMKELGVPNDMNAYEAMQADIKDAEQALAEFIAIREQAITVDTTPDAEGFKAGTEEMQNAVSGLQTQMHGLGASIRNAFTMAGLNPFLSDTEKAQQAMARFAQTLEKVDSSNTPEEARSVVEEAKRQAEAYANKSYADPEVVQRMQAAIQTLTEAINENAAAWEAEIAAQQKIATFSGWDEMIAKWKEMPTASGAAVNALTSGLGKIGQAAGTAGAFIYSAIHDPAGAADRALYGIASAAAHAAQGLLGLAKGALGTAANGLRTIAGHAANAARNLAKMAANAAVGAFKKLGSMITGIGNSTGKMNGGFKLSLGTILKYAFGIRSLYFLFNKLRRALVDGFQDIMTSDTSLKNTVNSLKQSLGNLKLAFASAIAPIAKIVLPTLTAMINALADAVNMVGMFIAALTGQKTFKKATAAQEGYAAAAGSAADALKEEKRQLAGFDQLEILSDSGSGGSGGSGGGGSGSGTTFEDVTIDSGLADWAEKLKEMFKAGDWDGIGAVIAGGINDAFSKLDELIKWENVGATVTKYVNAFCGVFNSMVDKINWTLIGKTFGDGINTILNTVNLLSTKINWENLGKKISEGLNGLVDTINWELFGTTLGNMFSAKLKLLTSAAINFDWGNLGTKLSEGINGLSFTILTTLNGIKWDDMGKNFADGVNKLISGVGWATIGETVGGGINGIIGILHGAVTEFQWGDAGKSFATTVNGLSGKVDWDKLGETIGTAAKGAIEAIVGFVETIKWDELGEDLSKVLENIPWTEIASGIFEAAGAALGGIAAFLWGVIKDKISGIKDYFDESIDNAGGDVALGILNGIANGFKALGTWVKENILEPFIEGFKKAFGISSPAKDASLLEAAGYVGEGILEGIAGVFKNIASWVENHILGPIKGALTGAPVAVEVVLEKAGEWAGDAWDAIKGGTETVVKTLKAVKDAAFDKVSQAFTSLEPDTVTKTLKAVKDAAFDTAKDVYESVKNSDAVKTIKGTTDQAFTAVKEKFTGLKNADAVKTIKGATHAAFTKVKNAFTGLKNSDAVKTIKGSTHAAFTKVKNSFTGLKNADAVKTIKGSTHAAFTKVKNAFTGLKDANATKTIEGDASSSFWDKKSSYDALQSETATKSLDAERSDDFNTGYDRYNEIEDKNVTVTVHIPESEYRKLTNMEARINYLEGRASGGVFSNGQWSGLAQFAAGGILRAGGAVRKFIESIPRFASGSAGLHGSLFLAGEAGPELVGHVGGRTEILNQSQLASTMYTAVKNGMLLALNPFASVMAAKMAECTNAIVAAAALTANTPVEISPVSLAAGSAALLAGLNDIARSAYMAPVLSRGTVVPYAASQAADTADIANAISAANTDMTDTLVQAIAAAATMIVTAVNGIDTQTQVDRAALARYTIDEINRRTAMFQSSPIRA